MKEASVRITFMQSRASCKSLIQMEKLAPNFSAPSQLECQPQKRHMNEQAFPHSCPQPPHRLQRKTEQLTDPGPQRRESACVDGT
jgi:hypothetical protein